jgi:hypothetical protein
MYTRTFAEAAPSTRASLASERALSQRRANVLHVNILVEPDWGY